MHYRYIKPVFYAIKPPIDLSTYYNLKNHLQNFLNTLFFTTHDIFIIIYVFCANLYKRNCMILKSNDVNPKIQFSPSFTVKLQLSVNIFILLFLLLCMSGVLYHYLKNSLWVEGLISFLNCENLNFHAYFFFRMTNKFMKKLQS